ncbi:TIGR03086 family metal-binding protein [Pengzhenrongella sp.]|uniref:TIGR03086 family metal-binding protein n=1 Tax=Pengzhenrongella sp. TaxID=2888820 RepID=UPI002F93719F
MPLPHDLVPTARELARLIAGVSDDQLAAPTPCDGSLSDLLDHVQFLCEAFTAAATRTDGPGNPPRVDPGAARLGEDWQTRIPAQVLALAAAWREPDAWDGNTHAGGNAIPAQVAGTIALNELVIHAWDLARASGQSFRGDPAALTVSLEFLTAMSATEQEPFRAGRFGPVVDVPQGASLQDRVIGLSGRDPS